MSWYTGLSGFEKWVVCVILGLAAGIALGFVVDGIRQIFRWWKRRRAAHLEFMAAREREGSPLMCKHGVPKLTRTCHDCAMEWVQEASTKGFIDKSGLFPPADNSYTFNQAKIERDIFIGAKEFSMKSPYPPRPKDGEPLFQSDNGGNLVESPSHRCFSCQDTVIKPKIRCQSCAERLDMCIFCDTRPAVGTVCRACWSKENVPIPRFGPGSVFDAMPLHGYKPPEIVVGNYCTYKSKQLWPHSDAYDPEKPEHRMEIIVRMFAIDHEIQISDMTMPPSHYPGLNKVTWMWFVQPIDPSKPVL